MTKPALDDLEAVRAVAVALEGFEAQEQERIIRWAREKLGLAHVAPSVLPLGTPPGGAPAATPAAAQGGGAALAQNIRSFVEQKAPQSDTHFAATVAYYYQFQAPEAQRKDAITSDDLQDACRQADRARLKRPITALGNALRDGLLDKAGRGTFRLNSVGENLVAMALPAATGTTPMKRKPKNKAAKKKKAAKK